MSFIGNYVQDVSNLVQNDVYNPIGAAESKVGGAVFSGITPKGDTPAPTPTTKKAPADPGVTTPPAKEGAIGSPGGILGGGNAPPPTTAFQGDINAYMKPYIDQLTNLGPEYGAELSYLQPYLTGNQGSALEQSVAKEYGGSGVQAPNPNTPQAQALQGASQAQANVLESQNKPGFANIANAAKAFESTVPYSDVLGAIEGAQKNELLYGSVPNFSAVNTSAWGPSMQALYSYLQKTAGGGSSIGVNPATASNQLTQQQNQTTYNPGTQSGPTSNQQGGSNIQ
jgi:hypothetical protein